MTSPESKQPAKSFNIGIISSGNNEKHYVSIHSLNEELRKRQKQNLEQANEMPQPRSNVCLVLDTNILFQYLDLLKTISKKYQKLEMLVPYVVLNELDSNKQKMELGMKARHAIRWINENRKNEKRFFIQVQGNNVEMLMISLVSTKRLLMPGRDTPAKK
jgi:rRNA-processing protein FCF1